MKTIVDAVRRGGHNDRIDERSGRLEARKSRNWIRRCSPSWTMRVRLVGQVQCRSRNSRRENAAAPCRPGGTTVDSIAIEQPQGSRYRPADPEQLRQLLLNLSLNAFDAIGHDGTLAIRIGPGELGGASR